LLAAKKMNSVSVNIFSRKGIQNEHSVFRELPADWNLSALNFSDSGKVLQGDWKFALIHYAGSSEELVRVSTEILNANPGVQIIILGDQIPGIAVFHSKAVLALSTSEMVHLPGLLSEILQSQVYGSHQAAMMELQDKNAELKKINHELDRFVYSASHDLRSPLTSVLGLLYLLRVEVKDDGAQRYVDLMEESILKLDNIIRDIVAYSRNNRTELQIEAIKLNDVMTDVESGLRYLETPGINIQDAVKVDACAVFASDRNRLTTILNNLISNSIKYRHPSRSPEINVSVDVSKEMITINVRDNGIGIKDYHLGRIFEMFYRTSDHSTGSGLGLYIVKETINKLGGDIKVESEVNQGTQFTIQLPAHYQNIH
jgi:signal transduction histidine kinase